MRMQSARLARVCTVEHIAAPINRLLAILGGVACWNVDIGMTGAANSVPGAAVSHMLKAVTRKCLTYGLGR
jgi:calcineurin-like phosphoesterase